MARPKEKLLPVDEALLRNLLNLGSTQSFPRCPGKCKSKVKALVKLGHHEQGDRGCPVTEDNRCDRVAGSRTTGDCYGIGRPDLGHYGTGLCGPCQVGQRKATTEKIWKEHLKAMQNYGRPVGDVAEIEHEFSVEAKRSEDNIECADAIVQVRNLIAEMDELEANQSLTEKGGMGPQPMSDATRIKLKMDRAKLLNELGKTKFELSREMHVPIDVLNLWVRDTIILAQEVCVTKEDYEKFVRKFKQMIMNTRNQAMTRALVGVGSSLLPKAATIE